VKSSVKYSHRITELETLIRKIQELTPQQKEKLASVHYDSSVWEEAWEAARSINWISGREDSLMDSREDARRVAWDAARRVAWDAIWKNAWDTIWENDGTQSKIQNVILDALTAVAVKEQISPGRFSILYGPWASVMD
jgi:hypothetical protein